MTDAAAGSGIPFPGSHTGRRIASWARMFIESVGATRRAQRAPRRERSPEPPLRARFMEDASMAREMWRL
ncbi:MULTISPECIES: hypothetical protein [unclassified Mycobacterium]|uniref:hypothetical protein n=1 Tax=unclassified Mycobacterium TaxID=2642494 RepID=UPI0029C80F26|nr:MULTISPECIES: hypothetical protein [unclassified Mycobacterium]